MCICFWCSFLSLFSFLFFFFFFFLSLLLSLFLFLLFLLFVDFVFWVTMWFSEEQRTALEKYYRDWDGTSEVRKEDIDKLIVETGLTRLQVRGWLRNRKNRGSYKGRVIYHPNQVKALEWVFVNHSNYPHSELKRDLADFMGMSFEQVSKWFETRRRRGCPAAILGQKGYGDEKEWQKILRKIRNLDHIRASNYAKKRRTTSPPPTSSLVTRTPPAASSCPPTPILTTSHIPGAPAVPAALPNSQHRNLSFEMPTNYELPRSIGPTQTTQSLPFSSLGASFPSLTTSTANLYQQQFSAPAYQPTNPSPVSSSSVPPREERAKKISEAMAQLGAPANPLDLLCVASLCEDPPSPTPSPPLPSPSSSLFSRPPSPSPAASPPPPSSSSFSSSSPLPSISVPPSAPPPIRPSPLYPHSSAPFFSPLPTPLPPMRNSM